MPGTALPVGANSGTPVITQLGSLIYLPYTGDLTNPADGGVAIVNVSETACCSLIWKSLEGCPDCDTGDCIVLATIENYVAGDSFEDQTDPPADPATDAKNQMVRIDNRTGRKLLPSTSTLAEIVECICKTSKGGQGTDGLPGGQGPAGPGIDDVTADFVTCDQPGSAQIVEVAGKRTLELVIPGCCDKDFAHIIAMNWTHAGTVSSETIREQGFVIGFDRDFTSTDLQQPGVLQVLTTVNVQGLAVWGQVILKPLEAVRLNPIATPPGLDLTTFTPAGATANGIQFVPILDELEDEQNVVLRVMIDGDFIHGNDSKGVIRGADLDHLPPYVPARPTGDGIEGGTFVSWFTVQFGQ